MFSTCPAGSCTELEDFTQIYVPCFWWQPEHRLFSFKSCLLSGKIENHKCLQKISNEPRQSCIKRPTFNSTSSAKKWLSSVFATKAEKFL